MKKVIAILLFLVLLLNIFSSNVSAEKDSISSWAKESVSYLEELELLDRRYFNNHKNNISREEFACLLVKLYENSMGKIIEEDKENPFIDITNNPYREEIIKAYNIRLIEGIGANKFNPKGEITREEISLIIVRLLEMTNPKEDFYTSKTYFFNDQDQISYWAKNSIEYLYEAGIIKGIADNKIGPKNPTTKEQAYTLVSRIILAYDLIPSDAITSLLRGNSSGNLSNNGLALFDDDEWIYYINYSYKLHKLKNKDSENIFIKKTSKNEISYLNEYNEKIYFVIKGPFTDEIHYVKKSDNKFIKLNIDLPNGDMVKPKGKIVIIGDWLYFTNKDSLASFTLYRYNLKSSECLKICYNISEFATDGKLVFYSDGNDLFRINADGKNLIKISDKKCYKLILDEDYLYYKYRGLNSNWIIAKVNKDSGKELFVLEDNILDFNVREGMVYFTKFNNTSSDFKYSLYELNCLNQKVRKIIDIHNPYNMNIVGDWILYPSYDSKLFSEVVYKVKLDGSIHLKLDDMDTGSCDT